MKAGCTNITGLSTAHTLIISEANSMTGLGKPTPNQTVWHQGVTFILRKQAHFKK